MPAGTLALRVRFGHLTAAFGNASIKPERAIPRRYCQQPAMSG